MTTRPYLLSLLVLPLLTAPAHAASIPLLEETCTAYPPSGAGTLGAATVDDQGHFWALNASMNALVDFGTECGSYSLVDLTPLGITTPAGVAFDPIRGGFAITESSPARIVYITQTGTLLGSCDLAAAGPARPFGIAWSPDEQAFAVAEDIADEIRFYDPTVLGGGACVMTSSFDTVPLGSRAPRDLHGVDGGVAIFDELTDTAFVATTTGTVFDAINISDFDGRPWGIAHDPGTGKWRFVETRDNVLWSFDTSIKVTERCWVAGLLSNGGIAVIESTGQLVHIGAGGGPLYLLNATSCAVEEQTDLFADDVVGSGVAVSRDDQEIWVADDRNNRIAVYDTATLTLDRTIPLDVYGLTDPIGVTVDEEFGVMAVAVEGGRWALIDLREEALIGMRSLNNSASGASGLTFSRATGGLVLADDNLYFRDNIRFTDFAGRHRYSVPLDALNIQQISGIAAIPGRPGNYVFLDGRTHRIYDAFIPFERDLRDLNGYYEGGDLQALLSVRGDGLLSGWLLTGTGERLTVFGHHDPLSGSLAFGTRRPSGAPLLLEGTYLQGTDVIDLPAPAQPLHRRW